MRLALRFRRQIRRHEVELLQQGIEIERFRLAQRSVLDADMLGRLGARRLLHDRRQRSAVSRCLELVELLLVQLARWRSLLGLLLLWGGDEAAS